MKACPAFAFVLELFLCHVYAVVPEVVYGLTSCTESNVKEGLCIFSMRLSGEFLTRQPEFHVLVPTFLWECIQCRRQNRAMDMTTLTFFKAAQQRMRWPKGGGEAGLS